MNEALASLDGRFGEIYSEIGRPSIPPEQLLRAMLLQAFYTVRSERQLMERLDFDLLFRWFVGLGIDDAVWDASTFSKNRDRLLGGSVAAAFLSAVLAIPRVKRLLRGSGNTAQSSPSDAHSTGTGSSSARLKQDPGSLPQSNLIDPEPRELTRSVREMMSRERWLHVDASCETARVEVRR